MSNMHIADALEQGIFDIEDGCAKTMCAPHSVMKQGAGLIRLHEQQAKQLEAERDAALAALKVAREALNNAAFLMDGAVISYARHKEALAQIDKVLGGDGV